MGTRDPGRRAARRWTATLAAAGIALTGLVGIGTVHALDAGSTSSASSSTSTASGTGTATGFGAGTGTSQTGSSGS